MTSLRRVLPQPTDRLALGAQLRVSPLCMGMVTDARIIPEAYDAGVNFFFLTADMHWPAYEHTRRGLADLLARGGGIRDDIVVGAVSYVAQPEFCYLPFVEVIESIPELKRLELTIAGGTGRHDFPVRAEQYSHHGEIGVKAFGATFHDREFAGETMGSRAVQIGYVRYNPFHRGAETDLFPRLVERAPTLAYNFNTVRLLPDTDFAALGMSSEYWRPSATDYYRFVLARPALDGILFGLTDPRYVRELADALRAGPLTDEEDTYLRDLADLRQGEARLAR